MGRTTVGRESAHESTEQYCVCVGGGGDRCMCEGDSNEYVHTNIIN